MFVKDNQDMTKVLPKNKLSESGFEEEWEMYIIVYTMITRIFLSSSWKRREIKKVKITAICKETDR